MVDEVDAGEEDAVGSADADGNADVDGSDAAVSEAAASARTASFCAEKWEPKTQNENKLIKATNRTRNIKMMRAIRTLRGLHHVANALRNLSDEIRRVDIDEFGDAL